MIDKLRPASYEEFQAAFALDIPANYNFAFDMPYLRQQDSVTLMFNGATRTIGTTNSSSFSISTQATYSEPAREEGKYSTMQSARISVRCSRRQVEMASCTRAVAIESMDFPTVPA